MMGFSATEELRTVLNQARTEAVALQHEYVGTEHILLALVNPPSVLVGKLLATRNVDAKQVRDGVEEIVRRGRAPTGPDLPFTSSTKHALEFAALEARDMASDAMNTGSLFLGLLREGKGIAAQTLARLGFTLDAVRSQLVTLTAEGHGEKLPVAPSGDVLFARAHTTGMPPMAAVAAFQMMLRSPRVAAVLEQHHVDVQAIIRDLSALPPT